MTANLYELAQHFENALRNSNEYQRFVRQYSTINADPASKQLLIKLNNMQMNLEQKQMMGQEIRQQEVDELQKITSIAQQNQKIAQLMEADHQVNKLMMELNKIMTKPLEEIYSSLIGKR